jgi:hypothetical protein
MFILNERAHTQASTYMYIRGLRWLRVRSSRIYNYLCNQNQFLWPLRLPLIVRCTRYHFTWTYLSVTYGRTVFFCAYHIVQNAFLIHAYVNFQWDDDEVRFVPDQHAELDFYSASSLKQQSAGRYVAPLGHIILIPKTSSYTDSK